MKNKNFGWKEYFKPTPKNFRRFGDAMITAGSIVALVVPGAQWAAVIGLGGKLVSNFFSEK
jgi:hypothetical protein